MRWRATLGNPLLRLELQRVRSNRWWPGRRFFLFYPALLGAALGCGVLAALTDSLGVRLATLAAGLPVACLVSVVAWLLSMVLPWIAPALTASTIARERELGTLDLLRVTMLSEHSIVVGKLGSCLVRLWPGILVLILLSPFQIVRMVAIGGGGGGVGLPALPVIVMASSYDEVVSLAISLALTGVIGWLRQWGDLALHATVGLFASALCSSPGVAVAVSYGAILTLRVVLWLANSLAISLLTVVLMRPVDLLASPMLSDYVALTVLAPALMSLVVTIGEVVGAAWLVWGAGQVLKRR
jgi:hypothetical protein